MLMIGTITIFCKNKLCWRLFLLIIPCFDRDSITHGTKLKLESPPLEILLGKFFIVFLLVGEVRILYANVVTISLPSPSPISLPYRTKAGIMIFELLMRFLLRLGWSIWVLLDKNSYIVTERNFMIHVCTHPIECYLCDLNLLWLIYSLLMSSVLEILNSCCLFPYLSIKIRIPDLILWEIYTRENFGYL